MKTETPTTHNRWMSSSYTAAKLAQKPEQTDIEQGIIRGVSVVTEGEAKGHGVSLDKAFVETVIRQGNELKTGVKARFGHPNMCSTALGTFIGRFKNFRADTTTRNDGQTASRAVADLFMSNSAKETPNGNLYDYVMQMAKSEADMFGTSIVFTPGREYRKVVATGEPAFIQYETDSYGDVVNLSYVDKNGEEINEKTTPLSEEVYVECEQLHACDTVDDPAANDGLFSRFSKESMAGQVTEFLDLHPEVWQALSSSPDILKALSLHHESMVEFVGRYREYRKRNQGEKMTTKPTAESADSVLEAVSAAPESPAVEPSTPEPTLQPEVAEPTPGTEGKADEAAVPPAAEAAPAPVATQPETEPEPTPAPQPEATPAPDPVATEATDLRIEFKRMKDDFGAEVAAEAFASGGDYASAQRLAYERMKAENETLRRKVSAPGGGQATEFFVGAGARMTQAEAQAAYAKLTSPQDQKQFRIDHAVELGLK